ncbi:MAG TPA: DUF928 domain-containing protein [Trichormus sp. M33_DOE_039]|nr:DUF928 domain-containing protein [Trichormus sp. M33_DOE_039]
MFSKKTRLKKIFTVLSLSFFVILANTDTQQVMAQSTKGREGLPGRRVGGGTRGECSFGDKKLIALVPESNLLVTTSSQPNLLIYLPPTTTPKILEFVLQDDQENIIYEKNFTTKKYPGIVSISLPEHKSLPQLAIDKRYRWFFSMICNPNMRENDVSVDGWITRVKLEPNMAQKLESATSTEQVSMYANLGIWQDALVKLAKLRYNNPNDPELVAQWSQMLQVLKLETIVQEGIVDVNLNEISSGVR